MGFGLEPVQLNVKNHSACLGDGASFSTLFEICFSQVLLRLGREGREAGDTQNLSGFRENPLAGSSRFCAQNAHWQELRPRARMDTSRAGFGEEREQGPNPRPIRCQYRSSYLGHVRAFGGGCGEAVGKPWGDSESAFGTLPLKGDRLQQ